MSKVDSIIYYRKSLMDLDELTAASKYFKCVDLISNIEENQFVIGRYSLLPFYSDQEREVKNIGSNLINTYNQHLYVADLQNYVYDLQDLTPQTWSELHKIPDCGPFILKGETNSRKSDWKKSMFAENKKEAIEVHSRLSCDSLIGYQKIYIRKYVPLIKYMDGVNGMPITKEFRFFIAFGQILCGDYYWQNYVEELKEKPSADEVPKDFLQQVINIVGEKINFWVMDVALTQDGDWIVIELNDGQQSGLSCNNPEMLYKNLKNVLTDRGYDE